MSIIDQLIYDRVLADVQQKTDKGYYNATDLNRVIEAMRYLWEEFEEKGYSSFVKSTPDWEQVDIPTKPDMADFIKDLHKIRNIIEQWDEYSNPYIADISQCDNPNLVTGNGGTQIPPDTMEFLTFEVANDIERILARMQEILDLMALSAPPCSSDTLCGGDYL